MKSIVIETATTLCAVLVRNGDDVRHAVLDTQRRHVEALMPGLVELVAASGFSLPDLDRVIVDRGPGLYTGMRVGLATATGLAIATNATVYGVTSLDGLAYGAWLRGDRGSLRALVDGRRGEVFMQSFELGEQVVVTSTPVVTTATEVVIELGTSGAPTLLVGDGAIRYEELFANVAWVHVRDLTALEWLSGLEAAAHHAPPNEYAPLYLRDPDAVANFPVRGT